MKMRKVDGTARHRRRATLSEVETLRVDADKWRRFEAMVKDAQVYSYGDSKPYHGAITATLRSVGPLVLSAQAELAEQEVSGVPKGALWRVYSRMAAAASGTDFYNQFLSEEE